MHFPAGTQVSASCPLQPVSSWKEGTSKVTPHHGGISNLWVRMAWIWPEVHA